jgi:hypothetical protein
MRPIVALVQRIYFLVTGLWPLLSMRTFLAVIGAVLIYAQQAVNVNPAVAFLAVGSAASLVVVEIVYVLKGDLSNLPGRCLDRDRLYDLVGDCAASRLTWHLSVFCRQNFAAADARWVFRWSRNWGHSHRLHVTPRQSHV